MSRRGNCFRCGKWGHFARECYQPRVDTSSFTSAPGGIGLVAAKPSGPPKPDASKTQRWNFEPIDPAVEKRNEREFRVLLKMMWRQGMERLVEMLLARFGEYDIIAAGQENSDGSFLDAVPLRGQLRTLVEFEFQLGRRAEAHFSGIDGSKQKEFIIDPLNAAIPAELRNHKVSEHDLQLFAGQKDVSSLRHGWWHENGHRQGIPATLHRLSGITGRQGQLIGTVVRVGRTITGIVERMLPADLRQSAESVLLVGPPNSGKTTVLREFARLLSDQDSRVVVVVDKTSEIAGASNEPHPAIGASCRWVPVDDPRNQHAFMRMAVENLSPETLMVDEISTTAECDSAKTISQRGVQLIATCHGKSMTELVNDEDRSGLLGGVKSVTLSKQEVDMRVSRGGGSEKQVMMRKYEPLFGIVIELHSRELWYVHKNPKDAVDAYLRREPVLAWRATPGLWEQVVATPTEDGFHYEPELPSKSVAAQRSVKSMRTKGSDVEVPVAAATVADAVSTPARTAASTLAPGGSAGPGSVGAGTPDGGISYGSPEVTSPWVSDPSEPAFRFGA